MCLNWFFSRCHLSIIQVICSSFREIVSKIIYLYERCKPFLSEWKHHKAHISCCRNTAPKKSMYTYNSMSTYSKLVNYSLPNRARWYHWCQSHHHNHGILSWSRSTQITGQTCLGGKITPSAKSNHHWHGKFFARQIPDTFLPTSSIQVWFMWQSLVKSSEGSKFWRLPCLSFRSKCGSCCKIESLSIWSGRKWMFANSKCSPQKLILYL